MEYESRQVKWYWLLLFILFCSGVVYLLFSGNPYLYSHHELRSALSVGDVSQRQTIPSRPQAPEKLSPPTFYSRFNFERTAMEPGTSPRSRVYLEHEHNVVNMGDSAFEVQNVSGDSSGFYLSGKSPWVLAVGLDGKVRWRYKFIELPAERALLPVLLDDHSAYLMHPTGDLVALSKTDGRIRWVLDLAQEVVANPFIYGNDLMVPVKAEKSGIQLIRVQRGNGKLEGLTPRMDVKPQFSVSRAGADTLIFAADNKVSAFDTTDWRPVWTQTLTDPVKGPAVVVDNQIFVSTLGAKIVKMDVKKGKVEWETDLEKPAASPPAYLPIMHKLSFLDTSGALVTVDAKTGKSVWRYGIENRNPLVESWSARLKGTNIEEFKMDWLHKGWTIWSPCSERRFCIYTPGKGQLIQRVPLSGSPIALPISLDKRLVFFTQSKPGQYVVSQAVEEAEIKRLKAEEAKASD
ncbi:MAG: PQQ-like beta-propeller repeat protein [Bdellovibrionales bacterium]|nr:PQQ-like beta-propeller repeat protein [Bdellovibrionales bacterium]